MALRRHLVAAFVLLHACAVVVLSVPVPPENLRGLRPDKVTEEQVRAWAAVAERLGVPAATFRAALTRGTRAEAAVLGVVRAAAVPYARLVGAGQSWLMFGSVSDRTARLEIEVRTADGWRPLYVGRSDAHAWHRRLFDSERVRSLVYAYGMRHQRPTWGSFVDWVARTVAAERPDALAVRVQLRVLRIPPADELARTRALRLEDPFWTDERELAR